MRSLLAICALFSGFSAVSANATIIIGVDVFGEGTTTTRTIVRDPLSDTTVITPASMHFTFSIDIPDFVNGFSSFQFGDPRAAGVKSGAVQDLGNGHLAGFNFNYFENINDGRTCQFDCVTSFTTLAASTFAVRQLIPVPVPEPATWAMMLTGFGGVGSAMRSRRGSAGNILVQ